MAYFRRFLIKLAVGTTLLSALMFSIGIDEMDLGVVGSYCFDDRFGET